MNANISQSCNKLSWRKVSLAQIIIRSNLKIQDVSYNGWQNFFIFHNTESRNKLPAEIL